MASKQGTRLLVEACLLADILAGPADDAPRLILADWWQERGEEAQAELRRVREGMEGKGHCRCDCRSRIDYRCAGCLLRDREAELAPLAALCERAEFVRVQCELEPIRGHGHGVSSPHGAGCVTCSWVAHLERREREVLFDNWPGWAAMEGFTVRCGDDNDFSACVDHDREAFRFSFRRGFVASVHAPLAALLEHLPALVKVHPLEEVRATDRRPDHERDGLYWWFRHHPGDPDVVHDVPANLWDLMTGHRMVSGWWKGYDTEDAAHAALGDALLALARKKVNKVKIKNV